jgi:hypothetical protein
MSSSPIPQCRRKRGVLDSSPDKLIRHSVPLIGTDLTEHEPKSGEKGVDSYFVGVVLRIHIIAKGNYPQHQQLPNRGRSADSIVISLVVLCA